jgi:hypothetical protein
LPRTYKFDVSAYQSISCYLDTVNASFAGDILDVLFESWSGDPDVAGSVPVDLHRVTIAAQSSLAKNPGVNVKLPLAGPWLKLTMDMATAGTTVNFDLYIVGSSLPVARPWIRNQLSLTQYGLAWPEALFDSQGVAGVPSGATGSFYLAPVAESVRVSYPGTNAASGKITLNLFAVAQKGWRQLHFKMANVVNTGTNGGDQVFDIACPWGQALRLDIINSDIVGRMPVLVLWDTSTE